MAIVKHDKWRDAMRHTCQRLRGAQNTTPMREFIKTMPGGCCCCTIDNSLEYYMHHAVSVYNTQLNLLSAAVCIAVHVYSYGCTNTIFMHNLLCPSVESEVAMEVLNKCKAHRQTEYMGDPHVDFYDQSVAYEFLEDLGEPGTTQ